MTQTIEKVIGMESVEIEEIPKDQTEMDELLGDLNPRYYEEGIKPRDGIQKIHSMGEYSNFTIRPY